MKDLLKKWLESIETAGAFPLTRSASATGERNKHLGPRWEFARVEVTIEPAESLEVVDATHPRPELLKLGYPDWVVFGLLDVFMAALPSPMRQVRIILQRVEVDPVETSPMALRFAGRDAGEKLVKQLTSQQLPHTS